MRALSQRCVAAWDRFLFQSCDPSILPVFRIGYAILILVQSSVNWLDAERWYTDQGVLRTATAQQILGPSAWSVLYLLPSTEWAVRGCLVLLMMHACLLLLGVYSRWQSAAIFVWLVSFQNRNPMLTDGEDTVFRLFAFAMIWLPLDAYWSIRPQSIRSQLIRSGASARPTLTSVVESAWAMRWVQFEVAAIYASTALCKLQGNTWHNGTATWYVSRMSDHYGRWIPSAWFDSFWVSASTTWGALLIELMLPIALWLRPTRKLAIVAGFGLHLGIEFSMNLFLFQWIMMLGLLMFIVPSEWRFRRTAIA